MPSVAQVKAHCNNCGLEAMVDPSVIGRRHRKHKRQATNVKNWVAGPLPIASAAQQEKPA